MDKYINKVLFSEEEIKTGLKKLASTLNQDYKGKSVVIICVLKGACIFYSDLVRLLDFELCFDFIKISSYASSTESSGEVKFLSNLSENITGKDVLIIEDILDTGNTLFALTKYLTKFSPTSIKTAVLLDKPERRKVDFLADYKMFEIPDLFVVGYGLDYAEKYRNLPYIGIYNSTDA